MQINNEKLLQNFLSPSDKVNIAIFSDCYYPLIGGITSRVFCQARELSKYANVVVITGQVKKYKDDENLPFLVLRCKGLAVSEYQGNWALPQFDKKFKKLLLSMHIDVIQSNTYFPIGRLAFWLKRKKDIPVIQVTHQRLYPEYKTIVHSRLIAKILTKYSINLIEKADEVWTVSQNVVDFYHASGMKCDFKIDPSGTDKVYPENSQEIIDNFNKQYGYTKDDKLLICVGRVEAKQKNLTFLLDACKIAQEKTKFKLFFAGTGKDLEKLKKYADKIGLKDVTFAGKLKNEMFDAVLLRGDLHLFPSLNDNFGLTKVEAAVMQTPTLGIEGTAVVEGMTDCVNGFISKNDVNSYAEKIVSILQDEKLLKTVSLQAQKDLGKSWAELVPITYQNTLEVIENYKKSKSEKDN